MSDANIGNRARVGRYLEVSDTCVLSLHLPAPSASVAIIRPPRTRRTCLIVWRSRSIALGAVVIGFESFLACQSLIRKPPLEAYGFYCYIGFVPEVLGPWPTRRIRRRFSRTLSPQRPLLLLPPRLRPLRRSPRRMPRRLRRLRLRRRTRSLASSLASRTTSAPSSLR